MASYVEKAGKGSLFIFLMGIVGGLLGYVLRIFMSRNLSVEEFGLFYSVLAFLAAFGIIKGLGLSTTLTKYIAEFNAQKKYSKIKSAIFSVFVMQFIVGLVIYLPLIIYSDYIAANFFKVNVASMVLIIMALQGIVDIGFLQSIFQGMQNFFTYAMVEFSRIFISFFLIVFLIKYGALGVAVSYLITTVIVMSVFIFLVYRSEKRIMNGKAHFDKDLSFRMLKFGAAVTAVNLIAGFMINIDTIMLTHFRTLEEVGWYNVAIPTAYIMFSALVPITSVIFPMITELWAKKKLSMLSTGISFLVNIFFVITLPISLVMFSFPDLIIDTLFGESFLPASVALQILSLGVVFLSISGIFQNIVTAIGKPKINMFITGIAVIANTIMNFTLIPNYGILGAALSTSLSFFMIFLFTGLYIKDKVKINLPYRKILKIIFGGILSLIIIAYIKSILYINPLGEAFVAVGISSAFYIIYVIYTGVITKSDIKILLEAKIPFSRKLLNMSMKFLKD